MSLKSQKEIMYLLFILFFLPAFLNAMELPTRTLSETEKSFLREVLLIKEYPMSSLEQQEREFKEKHDARKISIELNVGILQSLIDFLEAQYEKFKEEKERFISPSK